MWVVWCWLVVIGGDGRGWAPCRVLREQPALCGVVGLSCQAWPGGRRGRGPSPAVAGGGGCRRHGVSVVVAVAGVSRWWCGGGVSGWVAGWLWVENCIVDASIFVVCGVCCGVWWFCVCG